MRVPEAGQLSRLASAAGGVVAIRTRNGHDWTTRFPAIARAVLKVRSAVIDGEAVIPDERCRSSFAELQADLTRHGSERAVLYAFDLVFLDGEALWKKPLEDRRLWLGTMVPSRSPILLSEDFAGSGADLSRIACENGLEGIGSKRLDRVYYSGRSRDWVETKCVQTASIMGYHPGTDAVRTPLATGFSEAVAAAFLQRHDGIKAERCPIVGLKVASALWVSPDLPCASIIGAHARAGWRLRRAYANELRGLAQRQEAATNRSRLVDGYGRIPLPR